MYVESQGIPGYHEFQPNSGRQATKIEIIQDDAINEINHLLVARLACCKGYIIARYRSIEITRRFKTEEPRNDVSNVYRNKQVYLSCLIGALKMKNKSYGIITVPINKSEVAKLAINMLIRVLSLLNLNILIKIRVFPNIIGRNIISSMNRNTSPR